MANGVGTNQTPLTLNTSYIRLTVDTVCPSLLCFPLSPAHSLPYGFVTNEPKNRQSSERANMHFLSLSFCCIYRGITDQIQVMETFKWRHIKLRLYQTNTCSARSNSTSKQPSEGEVCPHLCASESKFVAAPTLCFCISSTRSTRKICSDKKH